SSYNPDNYLRYVSDFVGTIGSGTAPYNVLSSDQSGVTSGGYTSGGTGPATAASDVNPGDTSSTIVSGATRQTLTTPIKTSSDKDYVKAYFVQGDTYSISIEGFANHGYAALSDSFFRVRDEQGSVLASPSDQAGGDHIDYVAPHTGWYFLSIGAGGPNYATLTGGYSFSVTLVSAPAANHPPVAAEDDLYVHYGQVITGN